MIGRRRGRRGGSGTPKTHGDLALQRGSTHNLTKSVTWASTGTAVATITSAGLATPKAAGSTTIRATLGALQGSTGLTVRALYLYTLERTAPLPVTDYAGACLTCGNTLRIVEAGGPALSPGLPAA